MNKKSICMGICFIFIGEIKFTALGSDSIFFSRWLNIKDDVPCHSNKIQMITLYAQGGVKDNRMQ